MKTEEDKWDFRIYEVYEGWLIETSNGGRVFVEKGNVEAVIKKHEKFIEWLASIGQKTGEYVGDRTFILSRR